MTKKLWILSVVNTLAVLIGVLLFMRFFSFADVIGYECVDNLQNSLPCSYGFDLQIVYATVIIWLVTSVMIVFELLKMTNR